MTNSSNPNPPIQDDDDSPPRPRSGLIGDAHGFLIGQRRIADNLGDVRTDTQKIIAILQGDLSRQAQQQTELIRYQVRGLDRMLQRLSRPVIDVSSPPMRDVTPPAGAPTPDRITQPTPTPLPPLGRPVVDDNSSNSQPPSTRQRRATADPSATVDTTTRQRDANGQFTGNGDNNNDDGLIGKLTESISHVQLMPPDTNGIDPTVDAVNELGRVLSPLGKVTGAVFGGIGRLFGRDGQQDIPRAQQRHNRRSERLMERLIDAVRGQGGGNGRVGLGGLGKAGVTGVLTTAALGAASMVVDQVNEWNDKNGNPIGELTAQVAAFLGNEEAKAAVEANKEPPPPPLVSDSPANMSWDERWLVLKSAFGSESARKEMREKYPDNDAGYYGMPDAVAAKERNIKSKMKWSSRTPVTLYQDIKAASEQYGVSPEYMQAMALIESRGNPKAVSKTGASGTYQFTYGTGKQYGLIAGGEDHRFNQAANTKAAARYAVDNRSTLRKSLGREPEPWELYLAHQQGAGGVGQLYNAIKTGRVSADLRKSMDLNGGARMSPEQFIKKWKSDYATAVDYVRKHPLQGVAAGSTAHPPLSPPIPSKTDATDTVPPLLRRPVSTEIPKKPATVPPVPKSKVTSQQLSPKIPETAKAKPMPVAIPNTKEVSSPKPEMVAVYTSPDSVSQNVGDRGLAHAITGGLGMVERYWA